MAAEKLAFTEHYRNNGHLKYIIYTILNCNNIIHYYYSFCIFEQLNAALVSIKLLKNMSKFWPVLYINIHGWEWCQTEQEKMQWNAIHADQLYSTKKQTVWRNLNRTSSIDLLIHSRTSRKKRRRDESAGRRDREERKAAASVGKLKNFINCVLRGGSSSTECSGWCWSAQGEWEGWHEGHGPQPPHKASWEPWRREIEEGKTERKRLGRVSPLPLCV